MAVAPEAHDVGTLAIAERLVAQAKPGEQLEAYVSSGSTTAVRAYEGDVESFTQATSAGVGVRVVVDGRQGFASAGTFDDEVLGELLDEARDNARFAETDPHVGLAQPDGVAAVPLDVWRDEVAQMSPDTKIELALALERRVRGADPRITGVRVASFADSMGERSIATTEGIRVCERGTFCSLSVSALARDGDSTTIGGGVSLGRAPSDLDLDRAAADAVRRAVEMLGAKQPRSARLAVVFEPRLAATLLSVVGGTLSGEAVAKGRSPFADRLSEQIAAPSFTLHDDPTDARSTGAGEYDGEGLAHRPVPLVVGGVLQGFLQNSYTARRAGTSSTASAVRGARSTPGVGASALVVAPGAGDLESLVAGIDHGLLVHSLSGLHSGVNPVSGDFSVGVEGLMIRNGARAEPVREATIASTIQRLLSDISAVGADLEWQPGGIGAVTLVVDDLTLSGT
jgi:PmbA protein